MQCQVEMQYSAIISKVPTSNGLTVFNLNSLDVQLGSKKNMHYNKD